MMRLLKIILIPLILGVLAFPLASCGSESDSTAENQVYTVQRGDLTIDITAVGNLALSRTEDLAFEMAGTVEEVLVEEAESVEEGQLLAKLDISAWEDHIAELEENVTQAERQVPLAKRQVTVKELDLLQAQINLQTAEDNLCEVEKIAKLKDDLENAEFDLRIARVMLTQAGTWEEYNNWVYQIERLEEWIDETEQELKEILAGSSAKLTTDEALELAKKKLEIDLAQWRLDDAQIAIEDAKEGIEDAEKAVEDAKEALDEAVNTSPEITAPFAGFITKVSVKGGDEVKKGTVAVVIADPTKFETEIMVSEVDILSVRLGQYASVQLDAMSTLNLSANVTHISPTATIQQGVVNYEVTVEIESLEAMRQERQQAMQEQQEAMQETRQGMTQGEIPERLKQAIEEGRITQEQAEEMLKRMQEGEMPFPSEGGQVPTITPEDFQLREGLTVTVSIIVDERNNVLLVPNSAITTQGRQTFVQVLAADGTLEQRAIQTGISDYQYTEVTDGLVEGEQIVVPQGSTATPTTQQQERPGRIMIPGMGGR